MNEPESMDSFDRDPLSPRSAPQPRAMGSPLPVGSGRRPIGSPAPGNRIQAPPPGRALPGSTSGEGPSGAQRAMNVFRNVMPLVQRLLPLLEGNVLTAISKYQQLNLLSKLLAQDSKGFNQSCPVLMSS